MQDGDVVDKVCPKCKAPMLFEMSFRDAFSYTTGHYTTDRPIIACSVCEYFEEYHNEEYTYVEE
jgi:hypothetical protein